MSDNHKILSLIINGITDKRHLKSIEISDFSDVEKNLLYSLGKILESELEISSANIFKMNYKKESILYMHICNEMDCIKYKIRGQNVPFLD